MAFEDYATAMEFRDLITAMVKQALDQGRPEATYARVYSIDLNTRSCMVVLTGDVTPVKALLGSIVPAAVDQTVRLEGPPGARYVADVMGQNLTEANGGPTVPWSLPTLGSGVSQISSNPLRYRVVIDRGSPKVQLRGQVNTTNTAATANTIFTLPQAYWRSGYTSIIISRNVSGGSNTAVMGVNTDGTHVADGKTTGVRAQANGTGVGGGQAATSASGDQATSNTRTSGPTIVVNNGDTQHQHFGNQHQHVGGAHQHPLDSVLAPTSLSFDSVEYFL